MVKSQKTLSILGEYLGTAVLVATVVGSGIMGIALSSDIGVALLINTVSTIFALGVLIFLFLPISGAQFNPAVTMIMLLKKDISASLASAYMGAQVLGAISGAVLGNVMFGAPALQLSGNNRDSFGLLVGEVVATTGLIFIILLAVARGQAQALVLLVPAWIGAAYFFTSSTSFANPAVTIGRMFTDSFSGIAPSSVVAFVIAQFVGALLGWALATLFLTPTTQKETQNV
jgi:glycerol uptake facilitator-like aquaporin